ncbi:MAG TPA: hypothetical protein VN520_11740 [Streptomyces sp.]|uniref:hypothetical protein n=1 Tax=Streptomyces sp. TaxID=1931 RepID=UPI002BF2407F|nr:hypothetical protein [Streptomyces sp.]HWU07035.1 hypothetical protein [Streptomyces sp.]
MRRTTDTTIEDPSHTDPDAAVRDEEADAVRQPGTRRRASRRRSLASLPVLALLAAGAVFFVEAQQLRDTPATANRALTDTAETTRVAGDVSSALGKVFSYSPQSTAVTKEAAKRLLAGKALKQYAALFGQVEKQAADQKLTLTSQAVRAGVTRLGTGSAHLLVFLDQVYEREGKAATTAAAQLSVTAELRGGRWVIVDITSR